MALGPANRKIGREVVPRKVAERLQMDNLEAVRRYNAFVAPFLNDLRGIAMAYAGRNKALRDEMVGEAVLRIMAAAGKGPVEKPQNFAMKVARNAMLGILRKEKIEKRGVQTRTFEEFLLMVDPRARVELPGQDAFKLVKGLLAKANVNKETKETFAFHYGLEDGGPKKLAQTARRFNIKIGTVESRLNRVKNELRRRIGIRK